MTNVIILTGDKQSGKTTFLKNWCATQQNIAGILTPIVGDKRCFYDIEIADFYSMEVAANPPLNEGILIVGKYFFSQQNFAKAATTLMDACADNSLKYLIIDEIGPLELKQHKGFYQALLFVLEHLQKTVQLIIVVRQNCIEDIVQLLNVYNRQNSIFSIEQLQHLLA
ncbi:MAG: hypothetical protein H7068_00750 [Pedobacter sp.]|nr:hypothetical protein [Chitinophagaceae bacterium]